jgi:Sulfotransferase family
MNSDSNYRVKQWVPPTRPEWVEKFNEEGACLDLRGVIPLDENSLLARAKANTGLSDFGRDGWHEPFKALIKGIDEEGALTLMGRLMTRSDLLMSLEARLRIEDIYKKHPEIEELELASPMLIIGAGRCGSSAMLNVLSHDPDNGTINDWNALFPCPPPETATYQTDQRIAIADRIVTQWTRVTPELASMHEFGGNIPVELVKLEAMSFQSSAWLDMYGYSQSFNDYIARQPDHMPALVYARRVLKLLQWKNPRQRWLLKSPDAMRYLPDTFKAFPNLKLIWMHRDPLKAVSSMVSMMGTLFWVRSDRPLSEDAVTHLSNPGVMAGLFNMVIDQIEQGLVPAERLHNVQYVDFVGDQMKAIETLYRDMGIHLCEAGRVAIAAYLRDNPRENRPSHKYSDGDAARYDEERRLYERYQSYFSVKAEM